MHLAVCVLMLCSAAHAGIVGMCKEHLGVALALKVPVFFVVTKVDICPGHVLQHSLATLSSILRKPGIKKKPYMVSSICTYHAVMSSSSLGCMQQNCSRLMCSATCACCTCHASAERIDL